MFVLTFHKNHRNHQNKNPISFAPWQETFADAGMGMGMGRLWGTIFWMEITKHIFQKFDFLQNSQKYPNLCFEICSYIQKMTLNLIETHKTRIYTPKHTHKTRTYISIFQAFLNFRKFIFFTKKKGSKKKRIMLICMALFISYVEGHTA